MTALNRGAGIHDGVDPIVAVAQAIDLDHGTNRQQIGIGSGNSVPHVDAGCGRRAAAVCGGGKPETGARGRPGVGVPELRLPRGVARIQDRDLVQESKRDGRGSCCDDLAPE